ncbi:MAG TPA: 3-hydroxyacyl-ACP dehydratase FabZ [Solimonas sp.]|nr:3-hydroxyacyl-ACP dehydratase FabZ [Solimonas sp.]
MSKTTLDIRDILEILPHRYPFLLIDRVIGIEQDGRVLTAIKNVTYNEPFFPGHFPGLPTMPGVIMLEAMAQACGILAVQRSSLRKDSGFILYFAGIDNCRFKRPVVPGDQLTFRVELDKQKRDLWKFKAVARVGEELACEAEMMCVLKDAKRVNESGEA